MKRWKVVLGLAILLMSMPLTVWAQEQKPFAQRECEREISMKKKLYTKALEEEDISEELFLEMTSFLENKEAVLTAENSTEEYGLFPVQYIATLYAYQDSKLEDLAVLVWYVPEKADTYIAEYNKDMQYIEEEFAIYGIEGELEIDASQFPILSAKG